MEPRRGENQEQLAVVPGAALTPPPDSSSSARHALEQAVLSRADLMMQPLLHLPAGDRRRERRMRNRASAQRSRARQHAYVNELETEARLLRQENEQLRSLCDEVVGRLTSFIFFGFHSRYLTMLWLFARALAVEGGSEVRPGAAAGGEEEEGDGGGDDDTAVAEDLVVAVLAKIFFVVVVELRGSGHGPSR
jgi:hypothetical protein